MSLLPGLEPASSDVRRRLVETARGQRPADLSFVNGKVFNVYTGELMDAAVAVAEGRIAWVGERSQVAVGKETNIVDLDGRVLVPAYIEPHAHPFMLYNPHRLAEQLLKGGTLTLVCDSLVFHRLLGIDGMFRFFEALRGWPVRYYWAARTSPQTAVHGGFDLYEADEVEKVLSSPDVLQLAEVTTLPAVLQADHGLMQMIETSHVRGMRVDGHIPGGSYRTVAAYAAAGISACHESITTEQVIDRLRQGLYVMLRHSSLRPDLPALADVVHRFPQSAYRMMLTTDGSTPEMTEQGMVDYALSAAMEAGIPPATAIQMATLHAAAYFRLESEIGGIAPGLRADLLVLDALDRPTPQRVFAGGKEVSRDGKLLANLPEPDWKALGFSFPDRPTTWQGGEKRIASWLLPMDDELGPAPSWPAVQLESAAITTLVEVKGVANDVALPDGILHCLLIGRDGNWVTPGLIQGFARELDGLACSFNCVLDPLLIGRSASSMSIAWERMMALGGGIVLVDGDQVVLEMPLEVAGFLSRRTVSELADFSRRFTAELIERGHPFHDPLYTLNFIPSDLLPGPRLTPLGLFDVKPRRLIYPSRKTSALT